jgi:hypothetical protein
MTVDDIIKALPFLDKDDFGTYQDGRKSFIIIENTGRQKVINEYKITYDFDLKHYSPDGHAVVSCSSYSWGSGKAVGPETELGSVSPQTCNFPYFVEVAQKRALDRLIRGRLGIVGNILGRDELPSFDVKPEDTNAKGETPVYLQSTLDAVVKEKERKRSVK